MASLSQLSARLVDLFGSPVTANPTKLLGNLGVSPAGNVLIGTSTDDGVEKLQVNGATKVTGTLTTTGNIVAASSSVQGTSTTGLISGATGSGTLAVNINYAGQLTAWNGTTQAWGTPYNILTSAGGTLSAGLTTTGFDSGGGQWRMVQGNYGAFFRMDGGSCYLMQTPSGAQYGSYNAYRPFSWNLSTGVVSIDGSAAGVAIGAISYSGTDLVQVGGVVNAYGTRCRAGNGGTTGNVFNSYWTGGALQMWIDGTNVGSVTFASDARLKHSIKPSENQLDRLMNLKPVSYRYKEQGIFKDLREIEGFLAHDVQAVIPSAVNGEPDAVDEDGGIVPQTLEPLPIISVTVGAVQELLAMVQQQGVELKALREELEALKAKQ
jgi:hypothetical protein